MAYVQTTTSTKSGSIIYNSVRQMRVSYVYYSPATHESKQLEGQIKYKLEGLKKVQ